MSVVANEYDTDRFNSSVSLTSRVEFRYTVQWTLRILLFNRLTVSLGTLVANNNFGSGSHTATMSIGKLPNELLVAIFAHVTDLETKLSCRLVNRRWLASADDRQVWTAFGGLSFRCKADGTISCYVLPIGNFLHVNGRFIQFFLQRLPCINLSISWKFNNAHESERVTQMWSELMKYTGRISSIFIKPLQSHPELADSQIDRQLYFNAFGHDHISRLLQRYQPKSIHFGLFVLLLLTKITIVAATTFC